MGMSTAIDEAVCSELVHENRPHPVTYQETMGSTYHYNTVTIRGFLKAVAKRLRNDSPSYKFDSSSLKPDDCVKARIVDLKTMIAQKTNPA